MKKSNDFMETATGGSLPKLNRLKQTQNFSTNQVAHYHYSGLGHRVAKESDSFAFDEFGQTLSGNFSPSQPFGFTGYQQDDIANTYYGQAREYMPENGRFVSEDIVKGNTVAPQTQNVYSYCYNAPLAFVDRDGKTPTLPKFEFSPSVETVSTPNIDLTREPNSFIADITRALAPIASPRGVREITINHNTVAQVSSYEDGTSMFTASTVHNREADTVNVEVELSTPKVRNPFTSAKGAPHVSISTEGKISAGLALKDIDTNKVSGISVHASRKGIGYLKSGGFVDPEGNKYVTKWTSDPLSWKHVAAAVIGVKLTVAAIALFIVFAPVTVPAGAAKVGGGATALGGAAKSGGGATALGGTLQQAFAALVASATFSNNTSCPGRNR